MAKFKDKVVGKIELSKSKSLHFMITEINYVDKFAQIRIYVESAKYTGYIKKGIVLSRKQLKKLMDILSNDNLNVMKGNEQIGIIDNGIGSSIIIRVVHDEYTKFKPRIDIRQYVRTENYEGWTKNGFRFNTENVGQIVQYLENIHRELQEQRSTIIDEAESSIIKKLYDEFNPQSKE